MSPILTLKEQITELRDKAKSIVDNVKLETRDLTEDEENEIEEIKSQIDEKKEELKKLQRELDEKLPKEDEEEDKEEENDENRNLNTNKSNIRKMKKQSLVKEIRNAIAENKKSINLNAETRAVVVQGGNGVHDQVVETEIEGILEPLYANSVLTQLGARWFSGLPMGDVQVPIMSKSTVKWEGEIDEADATANTFTTVKLQPKRLSAYIDISKQLLAQDTIGVENAIRRDLVNALNDKLEATLFGNSAATTEQPAGLFYNASETNVDDFAGLCAFESDLEDANINGPMKYVLSPKAKATFRSMIKGQNATGMVYDGDMDGTPAYTTTNVASKKFVYGDFSQLLVGSWGNIELMVDPYTQATKGCVRLIINAYFDFKVARSAAFAFGNVD